MSQPYGAALSHVYNRGRPEVAFLNEIVACIRTLPDEFFAANDNFDIYSKVKSELATLVGSDETSGNPVYRWDSLVHRKAVMAEILRVLGMFESGGNWKEGVDSSRRSGTTNENAEAGAWQESWNARHLDPSLAEFLEKKGITNGVQFQERMKTDHCLAIAFTVLLLRIDVKNYNRIANGPVRKGEERKKTWPDRPKLWSEEESIYPWLRRAAVTEFMGLLA